MYACTVRGVCHALTAPNPAFCGRTRVWFSASVGVELVVDDGRRIARAGERQRVDASGHERLVRRVERVDAQLEAAAAAKPDVTLKRQIQRAGEAAGQVVVRRLEAGAADQRTLEGRGGELRVLVVAAAAAGIADEADARRRSPASRSGSRCCRRSGS